MTDARDHICREGTEFHLASGWPPAIDYGQTTITDDGFFDVSNGEYSSIVNYCPWCGEPAPAITQIKENES